MEEISMMSLLFYIVIEFYTPPFVMGMPAGAGPADVKK
jgi:hypothetical protein